ncbi:hypothetical protein ACU4GD_37580 [Cupriavidus basilensis]
MQRDAGRSFVSRTQLMSTQWGGRPIAVFRVVLASLGYDAGHPAGHPRRTARAAGGAVSPCDERRRWALVRRTPDAA